MTPTWELTPAEEAHEDRAYWDAMYEGTDDHTDDD